MKKDQAIMIGSAAAALLVLGIGLRALVGTTAPPSKKQNQAKVIVQSDEDTDRSDSDSMISTLHSMGDDRARMTPGRISRMTTATRTEGYEAEKERAFGDAEVSGFVMAGRGPLGGANIELYENDPMADHPPLKTVQSDEEGSFTIKDLNDGDKTYIVLAKKDGYVPQVRRFLFDRRPNRLFFRMTTGTVVSGVTYDKETSQPLAGVTVYYPSQSDETFAMLGKATTDNSGRFTFDTAPAGSVRVSAVKDGYGGGLGKGRAPVNDLAVYLAPGAAVIRGTAVGRIKSRPARGAKVVVTLPDKTSRAAITGEDGTFEVRDIPPGPAHIAGIRGGVTGTALDLTLEKSEVRENVKLTLPDDLFVQGRVVHSVTDRPFPGTKVWFNGPRGMQAVVSDEAGQFGFETVATDTYTLEIHEKGYVPSLVDQKSPKGERTTTSAVERVTRTLPDPDAASDEVVVRMHPTASVAGVVYQQVRRGGRFGGPGGFGGPAAAGGAAGAQAGGANGDKRPAPGIDVVVDAKQGDSFERVQTRTDAQGKFFANLGTNNAGAARVLAMGRGNATVAAENVTLPSRKELEITLQQSTLRAQLVLSDGSPLSSVQVTGRGWLYPDRSADSNFALPPSSQITSDNGGFMFSVAQGQPLELNFEMPDGKNVSKFLTASVMKDMLNGRARFTYDPVSGDVTIERSNNNGGRGGRGGNNGNGNGGNNNGGNNSNNRNAADGNGGNATGGNRGGGGWGGPGGGRGAAGAP